MYNIPILLIVFKRLDTTQKVFSRIKEIQPQKLYIAADGPRINVEKEDEKCQQVREWLLKSIDWDCDVKTLFRKENLGCGRAVSSAIDWFFEYVDSGIILEDDCIPSLSFFAYVENLLKKYKDEKKVWHISGHNTMGKNPQKNNATYSFVPIQACWGWATWKDRWQQFKLDISSEDKSLLLEHPYFRKAYRKQFWLPLFNSLSLENIDTWDYQWTYRILINQGYCTIPSDNLIENIGFGEDSTHFETSNENHIFHENAYEINEIIHPKEIKYDWKLTKYTDKKVFSIPENPFNIIIKLIKTILKKLHLFNFLKRIKNQITNK